MSAIGIAITKFTSKFGILSRKASMRLSADTGQKIVDKYVDLGRTLNSQEIESVFKQCLPKKIKPAILSSEDAAAKEMLKRGASQETVNDFLENQYVAGMAMTVGKKKAPIFVNTDNNVLLTLAELTGADAKGFQGSMVAHELEHALEYNCRFKKILERKFIDPIKLALKKDKKEYIKRINDDSLKFQMTLQERAGQAYFDTPETLHNTITSLIKELSNGSKRKMRLFKRILDLEIPAYTTGNKVESYAIGGLDILQIQGMTADVYKKAQKIIKNI